MEIVLPRERQALKRHRKCVECGVTKPLNGDCYGPKIQTMTGFRGVCLKCERKR